LRTGESTGAKFAESVGVSEPDRAAAPAAAGTQEHLAINGATVVVATASQPAITLPLSLKATTPAALAVALITIGSIDKHHYHQKEQVLMVLVLPLPMLFHQSKP